jgi:hypothetical protein
MTPVEGIWLERRTKRAMRRGTPERSPWFEVDLAPSYFSLAQKRISR